MREWFSWILTAITLLSMTTIEPRAEAAKTHAPESVTSRSASLPTGLITDRLSQKQLKTWKAMERIALAQDGAGRPLRPVLNELFNWAKSSRVPIYIEMPKREEHVQSMAGQCLYERQPDPRSGRLAAVTIRLYTTVIDWARTRRERGERGFVPLEGLRGNHRYCEVLAHELAHAREAITHPEYVQLTDTIISLCDEVNRLRRAPGDRMSAKGQILVIGKRLNLLAASVEAPAIEVEQEVWRELCER
jgi:hypothetical protein